jgi:hypothetical protein
VISPASCRIRRIVEVDGAPRPSRSRCQRIVSGPASSPSAIELRSQLNHPLTNRLRRGDRRALRTPGARLQGVQATVPIAGQEAVEMPAGDPVLGGSCGNGQLLGNDLKDSNASSGHARDCSPTPGQAAPGDRRCGTRSARASATTAGTPSSASRQGVTDVPTHEGPITWDICPEPRHPRSPLRKSLQIVVRNVS